MRAVNPLLMNAARLTASNMAEPGPGEVVHGMATLYRKGEKAIIGAPTATVTISNGNPAVIGWAGHPLGSGAAVVFTTTVALPDGLIAGQTYYVLDPKTDSFTVSDIVDGAPIVTTSAGSGAHTATAYVHKVYESQKGTTAVALISQANPGVVTVNEHGAVANTPVAFSTTAALPAPLVVGTVYYVSATGLTLSTFSVSALVGGSPIQTTTAGSGVHTALFNPNVGKQPMRDDGASWADAGPTNAYALFDYIWNTKSYRPSPMQFTITPQTRIDSLAFVDLIADSVNYIFSSPGQPDIIENVPLSRRTTVSWSTYFFGAFKTRGSVFRFNLPPVTTGVLEIEILRAAGQVGLGYVVVGMQQYIGATQFDAERDRINLSKFERNLSGQSVLKRKRSIPKTSQQVRFEKENADAINDVIDDLNAVPALWVGIDDDLDGYFESVLVLGVYKRATMNLDTYNWGLLTLDLEGA